MKKLFSLLVILQFFTAIVAAGQMRVSYYVKDKINWKTHSYAVYESESYKQGDTVDVILFLHGNGAKGKGESVAELMKVEREGLAKQATKVDNLYINDRPVVLVAPQYAGNKKGHVIYGYQHKKISDMMDKVLDNYNYKKVHVTGLSAGGIGTGDFIKTAYNNYDSFGLVAGWYPSLSEQEIQDRISGNFIAWHGDGDKVVSYATTKTRSDKYNTIAGADLFKLVTYSGVGHNVWSKVYDGGQQSLYMKWLNSLGDISPTPPAPLEPSKNPDWSNMDLEALKLIVKELYEHK